MPGRPNVITQNANGAPANPSADIVSACAIIAPAYQGTLQTKQYSRRKQVYEQYLEGPLVRAATHCIEAAGVPVITQRCAAASNVGAYDTIDNAGFTGTAVPAVVASSVPRNECELYFVCVVGGTIGSADPPITYRLSTAAGRGIDAKDIQRLGTGSRLTFGDTGAAIELDPPSAQVTIFIALALEIRADLIAHFGNAVAHNSADATAAALITLAAPTTGAEAWAVLNQCRLAWASHLANQTAHDSADIYNTLSAPAATTIQSGVVLAIELKADINAHLAATYPADGASLKTLTASSVAVQVYDATDLIVGGVTQLNRYTSYITFTTDAAGTPANAPAHVDIAGTNADTGLADTERVIVSQVAGVATAAKRFLADDDLLITYGAGDGTGASISIGTSAAAHNSADVTNTVTSTSPTTGTVVAGDVIQCQTFAPTPTTTELATAFTTIAEGDKLPGLVLLPWRVTPSYGATITTGLSLLRDNGLPCRCIVQARRFDVGTDTDLETYRDNLETEWSSVTDDRITVVATDLLFVLADGSATLSVPEKRLTGGGISFAARAIATPLGRTTWAPADGPIEGGSLIDDDGVLIGWNEPLGVQTRLQVFYRVPDAVFGRPTVPSKDFCLTDPTSSIKSLRVGRILDQVDRIVRSFAWNEVGLTAEVTINPSNTAQGVLSEDSRQDLIRRCAAKLESDPVLQSSVTNLSDSDLVTLESDVTVEGDVVFLEFGTNINPRLGVGKITFTHNVKTGGS